MHDTVRASSSLAKYNQLLSEFVNDLVTATQAKVNERIGGARKYP